MTKTALANLEIQSREGIAARDREHKSKENALDRKMNREEKAADRKSNEKRSWIQAGSNLVGGLVKGVVPLKNDPAWYKSYISDVEAFVNVPTFDRLGNNKFADRIRCNVPVDPNGTGQFTIPGIIGINWVPAVGPQEFNSNAYYRNAVNQTLARTKEKVLALNSRSSVNWEAADLGYNIFCSADILGAIEELGRAIKAYQTYHKKNAYFAQTLVEALGFSYSDMDSNIEAYRKQYIKLARKFNSAIIAPASMSIYARRMFLAGNVFADTDDPRYPRQMYAYKQLFYLQLSNTGTECETVVIPRGTLSGFTAIIEQMIARITDNPDFGEMYQDLRHAFKDLVQIPTEILDVELDLDCWPRNRLQIHNLRTLPATWSMSLNAARASALITRSYTGFELHQDTNGYLYQGGPSGSHPSDDRAFELKDLPQTSANLSYRLKCLYDKDSGYDVYNVFEESASGDDILDITRWGLGLNIAYSAGTATMTITDCGTEVALSLDITSLATGGKSVQTGATTCILGADPTSMQWGVSIATLLSSFDWSPITHFLFVADSENNTYGLMTDIEAHTTFKVDVGDIRELHSICVMSELYSPDVSFTDGR